MGWDVTSSSGFALWKLNIEALINSDEGVQLFCGVHTITPAIMPHLDAHFAARPPAQQADALLIYKESHAKCVNTIYRRILATIDISHDSTLLRIIDTEFAPQIGKRPAQIWRLLDLLFSRGSRSLTTSQIEIENRVTSWQIPFGKSPLEIARSFLTFVADWWDPRRPTSARPRGCSCAPSSPACARAARTGSSMPTRSSSTRPRTSLPSTTSPR